METSFDPLLNKLDVDLAWSKMVDEYQQQYGSIARASDAHWADYQLRRILDRVVTLEKASKKASREARVIADTSAGGYDRLVADYSQCIQERDEARHAQALLVDHVECLEVDLDKIKNGLRLGIQRLAAALDDHARRHGLPREPIADMGVAIAMVEEMLRPKAKP